MGHDPRVRKILPAVILVAVHRVERLGAASGAGEDEGALDRGREHRRLLVRYRGRIFELDVCAVHVLRVPVPAVRIG
jgi:hypothetical protein